MTNSEKQKLTVALCGNPNSGKTTLFNRLTGSNQKVGNWPGVTVEQKQGVYRNNSDVTVVDTPGVYSLKPYSVDEQITNGYLLNSKPDLILNIVDATNLERSLLLTTQLLELDAPVIVALNMQDEAEAKGIKVDEKELEQFFGCKFFPISAANGNGINELMDFCTKPAKDFLKKKRIAFSAVIEKELKNINTTITPTDNKRWRAISLNRIQSTQITEERYLKISEAVKLSQSLVKNDKQTKRTNLTERIDKIVLHKWLAFPIFFVVMAAIFYFSIDGPGGLLTNLINERFTPLLKSALSNLLADVNAKWLSSLIVDGIVSGVMSIVGFTPQIMILFGFISALEASGYMSRIAFITDRLLNKLGLGGRSFVSMILGCGCSVPAIMSTRTIKNTNERNATITLAPFMPCSAKLAVISFFTANIFGGKALFAISFYIVSILAVILGGYIIKLFNRKNNKCNDAFIMELPEYRVPHITNVLKQMWERGKAFLLKAGTIIFAASVILWILQTFNFKFEFADTNNSMLAEIGKFISPVFVPLGFNDKGYGWQFSVATLTGIFAKETVITTLEILLPTSISNCISALGAFCFVTYNLLTVPCIAAISASFTEQGNIKNGLKSAAFQIVTAYSVSLAVYQIGLIFARHTQTAVIVICIAAVAVTTVLAVVYAIKHRKCCGDCAKCTMRH